MGGTVRRAAGWHAPRPAAEDIRELAELLLEVAPDDAQLAVVVHRLALWCRYATPETATGNMIRDHDRRAASGDRRLAPLVGKALGFHRCCSSRAVWAWLACR